MCLISQANCAIQQVAIHTSVQGCVFIVSVGGIQEEYTVWVPVGGPGRCYHEIYQVPVVEAPKEHKRNKKILPQRQVLRAYELNPFTLKSA